MEKRNYPIERKLAPTWQCPVCDKIMSSRGRSGHLEKVHGRGKPLKENSPRLFINRIVPKKRPVARADVRNLMGYVSLLLTHCLEPNDILLRRQRMLQCEYLFREFELKFNCTLEKALKKFPELRFEEVNDNNSATL